MRIETVDRLCGLTTGHLLLFRGDRTALSRALTIIESTGFSYERCTMLRDNEYAAIATTKIPPMNVLTKGTNRISTGIFAATVALWAGASEIVLAGFSLSGGHSYLNGNTPRNHAAADAAFFLAAARQRVPITTTSDELHSQFGIPLLG
jgi:hypothetical protein